MHLTVSPSPTGTLDARTIARFRDPKDGYLALDRSRAGLSDLTECADCDEGIAERIADDYDPESGTSFVAINGSSSEVVQTARTEGSVQYFTVTDHFCPACTARRAAEKAA